RGTTVNSRCWEMTWTVSDKNCSWITSSRCTTAARTTPTTCKPSASNATPARGRAMAADWIKMRTDLQSHPKVVRILSATGTDKFRVIGGLHAVWGVFDTHTTDGVLRGYTPDLLDHVIGWEGFARAMESVGWLTFDGVETLALPEFEAHNGQSAKRRAE